MTDDSLRGEVKFYDEATDWGVIEGDDGRFYGLRRGQIQGRPPRPGDRVAFEALATFGGPRATGVRPVS